MSGSDLIELSKLLDLVTARVQRMHKRSGEFESLTLVDWIMWSNAQGRLPYLGRLSSCVKYGGIVLHASMEESRNENISACVFIISLKLQSATLLCKHSIVTIAAMLFPHAPRYVPSPDECQLLVTALAASNKEGEF